MNKIARFEKVSYEQFKKDIIDNFDDLSDGEIKRIYDEIKLPRRATKHSAGHDFKIPFEIGLKPKYKMLIPTGIKCKIDEQYVMLVFPRSSFGIKKGMVLANTVGVIDSDYYFADNEGHVFICVKNCSDVMLKIKEGESFCQAVFVKFGTADDESVLEERKGGIGSTNKN